jgi:hypothetical protein
MDLSRYCLSIVKKYLNMAGCTKNNRRHEIPLVLDCIPRSNDCSASDIEAKKLTDEFNTDFASCIGSLIFLGMTHTDVSYAVNKLAKFARKPGRKHFEALLHLLWYLCNNSYLGLKYYSNIEEAPLTKMLMEQIISRMHLLYGVLRLLMER